MKHFIVWSSLLLLGCGQPALVTNEKAIPPVVASADIYHGGSIITMAGDTPEYAEAVVVENGFISFVGSKEAADKAYTGKANYIDLRGQTMLPGFIDAHSHVFAVGLQASVANLLPPPDGQAKTVDQMLNILKDAPKQSEYQPFIQKTGVIIGFGYDDAELDRYPQSADLDKVSTELPVLIMHTSGHLSVVNSVALKMLNITAETKNPPGGVIRRKSGSSEPDGVLEETAHFMALGKLLSKMDLELQQSMFQRGQQMYASYGYTTAQEGRASADSVAMMQMAAERGELLMDVVAYPDIVSDSKAMSSPYYASQYKHRFRIAGVKLTLDGSPQGKTAWLSHPYHVVPVGQEQSYAGYPVFDNEKASAFIDQAYSNKWQLLVHANGDAAIDQMLDALEVAAAKHGNTDRRTVLIHGQTLRADQITRLKSLAVFPSLFPMHTYYWGDWHRESVLGEERANFISPTRSVRDAGLMFTSHHDAPVALPSSLRVLHATVNRVTRSGQVLGADQRVDAYTALKAMTHWAAHQHFEEQRKGKLAVGFQADFVILNQDPLKIEPMKLNDLKIIRTISAGKTIFETK
ncbi:amidohydrolase [Rheinheimera texasensis]|uniref:amidohydrolase n=1 Tax=Rheinheimera texasensis TaxID=306205 RepID=UPI0004E26971|nr:amidohydrolase [Rheinheimera texasensis]